VCSFVRLCEYHTMRSADDWADVGDRVREARLASGFSQTELARQLGVDRTAIVRIEAGQRQVSAVELFKLSDLLGVPAAYFVTRPPVAVVSQRQALSEGADAASRTRFKLDAALESHARDTGTLIELGVLARTPLPSAPKVKDSKDARKLAAEVRRQTGLGDGPINSMAELGERFGLYMLVVDQDVEGASLLLDGYGVAVVGGRPEPGRRRFTAAHELGHHLLQDAYHTDIGVAASAQEREAVIDAFAADLLLPPTALKELSKNENLREELVRLAGVYRVSWSVIVSAAEKAERVPDDQLMRLRAETPVRGEFLAVLGEEPIPDLSVGDTGPAWRRAVLAAWEGGLITAARTIELLGGGLSEDDLPPQPSDRNDM
jgi:transcriptional regulator with XRE-family HTH domain/Zn-dependent peptidase ImmA (M78 family)